MRPCCTLAILLTLAAPAPAASIRGHVTVQPLPPAGAHFRPYAARASSLPGPERPPRGLVTDAVIYLESLAAGAAGDAAVTLDVQVPESGDVTQDVSF